LALAFALLGPHVRAAEPNDQPTEQEPVLRVEAGGPTAYVSGLAFSPDELVLYAGGHDKVVHTWALNADASAFTPSELTYRVPVGPGIDGSINAVALSPDGTWLAVGGRGRVRGVSGFRNVGVWVNALSAMTDEMWQDQGAVTVFNTRDGSVRQLRGHRGQVIALAFAAGRVGKPILVSAAREVGDKNYVGKLRAWNVEQGKEIDALGGLPDLIDPAQPRHVRLPRLTAWADGDETHAAVAWEDASLRLWDMGKNQVKADTHDDGPGNNLVALLSDRERLVTGSVVDKRGILKLWTVGKTVRVVKEVKLAAGEVATALTVVPGKAGSADRLAVISDKDGETFLQLYDLPSLQPLRETPVSLWKSTEFIPRNLVVSPGGRFLALTGTADNAVTVFNVADLLKVKDAKPLPVLRSVGEPPHSVGFVKKDGSPGLLLGMRPGEDDLVFDFAKRALIAKPAGWKVDAPPLDGWAVEAVPADKPGAAVQLKVQRGAKVEGTVQLRPNQGVSAHALLPATDDHGPLLAVAVVELGQPLLGLYDVRQNALVRQYVGHLKRIRGLAFAGDGRLLVSVADDQTVCAWGLADLDRVIGKHGLLRGMAVTANGKTVEVAQLDSAALTAENDKALKARGIERGAIVEGFVEDGKLRQVASVTDFYFGVDAFTPGKVLTLRFKGKGDIPLTVSQGADEHKQLFSLFITRPEGGKRHWVGWNPIGPYDCSDADAEKLLGWQKNTNDPARPVAFALAAEYRTLNFKPDILRYLAKHASTPAASQAWGLDHPTRDREPKMTVWVQELGAELPFDSRGRVPIARPKVTLKLTLQEPPLGRVEQVKWQVAGLGNGVMEATGELEWSADLSAVGWKRGDFPLRVTVRDSSKPPRDYARELVLRYQPARPEVKPLRALPRAVDQSEYRLEAEIVPAEGQTARARLQHLHDGKDLIDKPAWDVRAKEKVDRVLKLEPGVNQIRLVAMNEGADEKDVAEAEYLTFEVLYKTPQPQITLSQVETEDGGPLRIDPSKPDAALAVQEPKVVIVGGVEALGKLTEASFALGEGKPQPLEVGKGTALELRQEITLPMAGKTVDVKFRAKAAGSNESERVVRLRYEPKLPELKVTSPVAGQPFVEGRETTDIQVKCRLRWSAAKYPCTAVVVVDGKEQGQPVAVAAGAEEVALPAKLKAGENTLQVHFKNDWRESDTPRVLVNFRRPPRVVKLDAAKQEGPFANLTVQVESTQEISHVRVRVRGDERVPKDPKPVLVERKGDVLVYKVALADVPLQQGPNPIEVEAANLDGWSLEPGRVAVQFDKPAPARAEVALFNPDQDLVSEAEAQTVDFHVTSKTPLKRVELQRGGMVVYRVTDPEKITKTDGIYDVRETATVDLLPGSNELRVVAVNEGGEQQSRPILITYQPEPVRVVIDRLEGGNAVGAVPLPDGRLSFPGISREEVELHGKVTWGRSSDTALAKAKQVRVYLNGSQQPAVELTAPMGGTRARTFQIKLRLQRGDNQVVIKLPEAAEESGSRNRCVIDCTAATVAPRRQAHVLVVDTERSATPRQAVDRVLAALQAKPVGENRLSKAGFDDGGRIYGPLVGDEVTPERVYVQLLNLKRNLRLRASSGAVHDVVFLYFRGGETVDASGHFFRTSDSERDPELRWSGIPCDYLTRFFAENLGAQVVLVDVDRTPAPPGAGEAKDQVSRWSEDANLAVLRYAWKGAPAGTGPRLLDDWRTAVTGGAQTLQEVADKMSQVGKRPEELFYSRQVAPALRAFPIGAP
jgi:WD40 repeat protein